MTVLLGCANMPLATLIGAVTQKLYEHKSDFGA